MFRSIDEMTDEEKIQEIKDLEHLLEIKRLVSVDTLLDKQIDTSLLQKYKLTITPNGEFFDISKQGFLPKMMEDMYNDRKEYKKKSLEAKKQLETETDPDKRNDLKKRFARYNNLQLAKKVCLNSAYGALGNEFFRFFDIRQATAITTSGQLSIRWIEKCLNQYMNKVLKTEGEDYVIASDTDSIYLSLDKLVSETYLKTKPNATAAEVIQFMDRACESAIQPFIDKSYRNLAQYVNAYEQKMRMKREALADQGVWTAKKRYILNVYNNEGIQYAEPEVKVMGLEMIKSSTPNACRAKLSESIDILFNKGEDDMIQFIENFRQEFSTLDVAEIASPRGVNGLTKYKDSGKALYVKGTPIHVRGSLIYNNLLVKGKLTKKYESIKEGEKIKYIYLKEPNPTRSDVICFPTILPEELNIKPYIDYTTQFDKTFLEPLKIILDCVGWKTEKSASLSSYFE